MTPPDPRPASETRPTSEARPTSETRPAADHYGLILVYHRVSGPDADPWRIATTPAHFDEHMAALARLASPVPLARLAAGTDLPDRPVAVTFDDGYADNLHQALPVLERHAVPATVFVTTGYVGAGGEFWADEVERLLLRPGDLPRELVLTAGGVERRWDLGDGAALGADEFAPHARWWAVDPPPTPRHAVYLELAGWCKGMNPADRRRVLAHLRAWAGGPPPRPARRPLDVGELRALSGSPLVETGAHTVWHPALSALPPDEQRAEVEASKSALERWTGKPVYAFAYPFGGRPDYTPATVALLRGCGFAYACSAFDGAVTPATDRFQMPRLYMPDCGGGRFAELLDWWFRQRPPAPGG